MKADPARVIAERQRAWARTRGVRLVGSKGERGARAYTETLDENLFEPLMDDARDEYGQGDGGELGRNSGDLGKMQAVHSSSALCCNVFHYWRRIDRLDVVAEACGAPTRGLLGGRFEQPLPIDTSQFVRPPNLDVLLRYDDRLVGIESKYGEPFSSRVHAGLKPAYLTPSCDALWRGFPALRELAARLSPENRTYRRLDAPQLLKHVLGLSRGTERDFTLVYLYYAVPGSVGAQHAMEAADFARVASLDGVLVTVLTYQDLIVDLVRRAGKESDEGRALHASYVDYIAGRYL